MIDSVKEQLSACLDGELRQQELALLAKRVSQDRELRASVTRYALVSETLRTGKPVAISQDFSDRLMSRIQAEAIPASVPIRKVSPTTRFIRPLAGIAVAASVAALALFSVQRAGIIPSETTVADTSANTPVIAPAAEEAADRYVVPTTPTTSAFIPATRLTNYVVAHSEYSSPLGRQRVVSGMLAEGEPELMLLTTGEDDVPAATEDARR